MRIIQYNEKYKKDFIELNKTWISTLFKIEDEDLRELENVEEYIDKGGQIFFALDENGKVMACCMIAPREDGDWEIMKFAARGMHTGTGAGTACLKACIEYGKQKQLDKIILVSNRKAEHAIHLYRKFGFKEISVDKKRFPFERANIAFELSLLQWSMF